MSNHYEEKEQDLPQSKQPKLRLDFFLSLGLELSERDSLWNDFYGELVISSQNEKVTDCNVNRSLITYLAPRQNIGVQPCNGIVPIVWTLTCGSNYKGKAYETAWRLCHNKPIDTWKPDIDALIKMQNEHDAKQAATVTITDLSDEDNARINQEIKEGKWSPLAIEVLKADHKVYSFDKEDQASKNLLKAVLECGEMNDQLKFTVECKELIKVPSINMLARIEFNCPDKGVMTMDFTLKFETDAEYAGVDKDGFAVIVEKEEFIAWHAIDDRSELDIAKKSQLISYQVDIEQKQDELQSDFTVNGILEYMQDQGMLAEIVPGLK